MLITPKYKPRYPANLEREYAKILRDYVRDEINIIMEYVPEMVDAQLANGIVADSRTDDDNDSWITDITSTITFAIASKLNVRQKVERMFNKVKAFAHKENEKPFKSVFGYTPKPPVERQFEMLKTIWVSQNMALVKSIDSRLMESIHYTLTENVIRAASREELRTELVRTIRKLGETSEKRAILIASDQVGKLNSQLAQYEQMRQGVKSYKWITMGDDRVRAQHEARNGHTFYWNDPPDGGHPGYAIRCRCIARPCYDTDKINAKPIAGTYTKA